MKKLSFTAGKNPHLQETIVDQFIPIQRIHTLKRLCGNLTQEFQSNPNLRSLGDNFPLFRMRTLSMDEDDPLFLYRQACDFLSGMITFRRDFIFAVVNTVDTHHVSMGMADNSNEAGKSFTGLLNGIYPESEIERSSGEQFRRLLQTFNTLNAAALLTIPDTPDDARPIADKGNVTSNTQRHINIERFMRPLQNRKWGWLVLASPCSPDDIRESYQSIIDEITTASVFAKSTHMQSEGYNGSVNYEMNDKHVDEYTGLLQKHLERLKNALTQGAWNTSTYVFSEDPADILTLCGLFSSCNTTDHSLMPCLTVQIPTHLALDILGRFKMPDARRDDNYLGGFFAQRFSVSLTSRELASLTTLPDKEFPGYSLRTLVPFDVPAAGESLGVATHNMRLGNVINHGVELSYPFFIPCDTLTAHALICGITGSGKTNTCFTWLEQLSQTCIHFLVIESAKSEYWKLHRTLNGNLNIFPIGADTLGNGVLRMNPFEFPQGIPLQTHIDYLKQIFSAGFVLYPPMPYILEIALHEIYEDYGWSTARENPKSECGFPTLSDLREKVDEITSLMRYGKEIEMNVKAGFKARLTSLTSGKKGELLDTPLSIPIEFLINNNTVIELKLMADDDEKAFVIALLLVKLYEYFEIQGDYSGLRHITLIEEAHRLLRHVSQTTGEDTANPRGKAVEFFSNMLAEMRAYGEGFIITEQLPSKLFPDVIKTTSTKIIHRLIAKDDKDIVADCCNMNSKQRDYVGTIARGRAVCFNEAQDRPVLVAVAKSTTLQSESPLRNDILAASASGMTNALGARLMPYSTCDGCHNICEYNSAVRCHINTHPIKSDLYKAFLKWKIDPRLSILDVYNMVLHFVAAQKGAGVSTWKDRAFCFAAHMAEALPGRGRPEYTTAKGFWINIIKSIHDAVISNTPFSEMAGKTDRAIDDRGKLEFEDLLFPKGPGPLSPLCALCSWQCRYHNAVARVFASGGDISEYASGAFSENADEKIISFTYENIRSHFIRRLGYREPGKALIPLLICFLARTDAYQPMPERTVTSIVERIRVDA